VLEGGGETGSYFFSLGLTDQQNIVKNDNYKRYNYRVNLDSKVMDWLTVGIQSFLTIGDRSGASPSLSSIIGLPPLAPAYNESGDIIPIPYSGRAGVNPLLDVQQQDLEKDENLFGLIYLDADIPFIEGLNYRLNFSQNLLNDKNYNFNPNAQNFLGAGYKTNSSQYIYSIDNILSYVKDFEDHSINATLLYGYEKRQFESSTGTSIIFGNDVLGYNKLEAGQADLQTVDSDAWEETSLYAMMRVVYNFKDRYTLTGTVRRDGFSGFGPENKFAVFPSVAAAWRISEENFMKENLTVLDELKLRASYGENGNRTVGRYQTLAQINSSFSNGYFYGDGAPAQIGQFISSLPNPNLKWETTRSLNLGLDFSLFNRRIAGNIEYYNSNTFDLLYNINLPYLNGFSSTPVNIGELKNNGVELALNTVPIRTQDFSWNLNLNFSRNRNEVVTILGKDNDGDGREDDLIASGIFIGEPFGVVYDFNTIGMWQVDDFNAGVIPDGFTYGTYKVEDINGDGQYTANEDRKILGYTDPSYRFSIQNSISYKNWGFSFFINSIQGGKDYYYGQPGSSLPNPDNITASNLFDFDYWTPENPDARYKQIGFYTVALGETYSPYVQRDFVRLQDATISYNLPTSLLEKLNISRLKLFLNGKNLLTFTDYDGWDPESGAGLNAGAYPLLRSYTVGLSLNFKKKHHEKTYLLYTHRANSLDFFL
jgi:TonB-linked SusC/RagA family outer membrane protein